MSNEKVDLQHLDDNINHVAGVLELLFCAIASEHPVEDAVLPVIMDAQERMKEVKAAVDTLTDT
ncbi:MAG: hypothetical protein KA113_09115 [Syntrophaceae bacterium]|nr:hypothetical protein [Syntrophaceae bacterium]